MNMQSKAAAWCKAGLFGVSLGAAVASCGGGGGDNNMSMAPPMDTTPPVTASSFSTTPLVSDGAQGAAHTDPHLINAWGLAFNPTGFAWVANNGTSTSTLYGNGVPQTLVVAIPSGATGPANPTGIVYNGSSDFKVSQNGVSGASVFIFVGEGGTVAGWSPGVNRNNAVTAVDTGAAGAVYKGLAIGSYAGANYLYAADFRHGAVDVYDANFQRVSLPGGSFADPTLPTGYAPFGIQAIAGKLYVSYAQRAATGTDEVDGAGLGFVDVFDTSGAMLRRLVSGGALNAPWGMALAPANFGSFSNMLLVANFGDGKINAFDPTTGAAAGTLGDAGKPIVIDRLWGIAFGNGIDNQPTNTLFYTAGPGAEAHGLYGRIDLR